MMRWLLNILYKIFIHKKTYQTAYDKENVEYILSNAKVRRDFKIGIIPKSNGEYELTPKWSFTIHMTGFSQSIKVYIKLKEEAENHSILEIYTKPRIDLIIVLIIGLTISIFVFIDEGSYTSLVIGVIAVSAVFSFFRFIYWAQAIAVFEKAERFLKLENYI